MKLRDKNWKVKAKKVGFLILIIILSYFLRNLINITVPLAIGLYTIDDLFDIGILPKIMKNLPWKK